VKVLVVDSDSTRTPALSQTLKTGGAEVTVAPSGSFALTLLERNRHDVVVSRARLEDMDGHELCAILKADPGTRDVRFVLVAGPDEIVPADSTAAGVDLVLPAAMTGSAIVPLILRLMRADRAPAAEPPASGPALKAPSPGPAPRTPAPAPALAGPAEAAPEPASADEAPALPRIRPEPTAPPPAEPPRRYATAVAAAAAAPWSKAAPDIVTPAKARPEAAPRPGPAAPPVKAKTPAPAPAAGGPTSTADLLAIPSGTFQGSLEVMELADLTQAIAAGGKSGRLILALPQGGGLLLFDKGRVVHAEYRNALGEEAFGALLAACHGDGAGRFCFLPTPAGQVSSMPRTIDKALDRLLLSSATAIDEKG
jgi:CheY-like chemotaxis protein